MGVTYLGRSTWEHDSGTWTPPTDADFFIFGLVGNASGGGGTVWTSVTWDGLTESAQSATFINYHERVDTNGALSSLWYLVKPDCSGLGAFSYAGGIQNDDDMIVLAFKSVYPSSLGIFDEVDAYGSPDNEAVSPAWKAGGIKVCVVSHNGTAEVPTGGFTEILGTAFAERGAIGYRATDGNTGWNVTGGSRGAYCAATLNPKIAGTQGIWVMSKIWDRIQENRKKLGVGDLGSFRQDADGLFKPQPDLVTI